MTKQYLSENAELMKEWDWEANEGLNPAEITCGSSKKVWWKCEKCGGKWQTHISDRTGKDRNHQTKCPYCSGRKVLLGFNDLATTRPELAKEWHPTKNIDLRPTDIVAGSKRSVWWKCPKCGGEWQTTVAHRLNGSGCPYCANKKVLLGFNDLATVNPRLASEWHPTKNTLKVTEVTVGSHKKAWWKCPKCGHEWEAVIESRVLYHRGCPACSNKVCVSGKNDLATTNPNLVKEWHPTKNGNLKPTDVTAGYDAKVWWKCSKCGGEWQCHVYARTGKDHTCCPYCAGSKVLSGINDLATVNPRLASEWHPTKNGNLKPKDIYANSRKKVWWLCPNGHEYQTSVASRNYAHTNCTICNLRKSSSFPEQAIFYYVKKFYPDAINGYHEDFLENMELDVYIPSLKIAIEYDGIQWHKTDSQHKKEKRKYKFCKEHNIYLIRIKEHKGEFWEDTADEIYKIPVIDKRNFHALEQIICHLLEKIGNQKQLCLEVNIDKDKNEILHYLSKVDNSLADKRPDVAAKWHPTKNGNWTPDMFSASSAEVVWWKCPDCGNEFKKSICRMTIQTYGCSECAKIQQGKTYTKSMVNKHGSLAENVPELVKEWNPTKNGDLTPYDVTTASGKKVWWKCSKCGHEWQTAVADRGWGHRGCPECAKIQKGKVRVKFLVEKQGSLAKNYPDLAKEWHHTRNGELTPYGITAGSHTRVWWKCSKCGGEWEAVIRDRVKGLGKCPKCTKKKTNQLDFNF